ncbi:MAG: thioredoxin [Ruminococcaceae bacterium]|nr:thioredoxin [Oscillospiraceae bacterium]
MVKKINSSEFQSEVLNGEGVALVDLFADWCMPCQMIAPIIEEISNEKAEVKFFKINVDETPDVAIKYGVSSIPTLLVFKDGELINKAVGAYPKEKIVELLEI